jgi:hypothetical protein
MVSYFRAGCFGCRFHLSFYVAPADNQVASNSVARILEMEPCQQLTSSWPPACPEGIANFK